MAKKFQHQVCYSVLDRVTYINGEWQGDDIPESERNHGNLEGCPLVWDYLADAGKDGWELVTVLETPQQNQEQPSVRTFYLKRKKS